MKKVFEPEDIKQFVHEHIQSKIDNNELSLVGFDMKNPENFEREFKIYETALFEGICNGIIMCGCHISGMKIE